MIQRKWSAPQADVGEIRVLQFNVLAQWLSYDDPHMGGFEGVPRECLQFRTERLLQESLFRYKPHFVGMQECDMHEALRPAFQAEGYGFAFFNKPKSADGPALAFDAKRFEQIAEPQSFPLGGNQIAVWMAARDRRFDVNVVFCTTHLKAKKGHEETRLRQVEELFRRLNEICSGYENCVAFIAADLNAVPTEPAYLKARDFAESAMAALNRGEEPPRTTAKQRAGKKSSHTIDYIFLYQRKFLVEPNRFVEIPTEEELPLLPSWRYPSDHFALCVGFVPVMWSPREGGGRLYIVEEATYVPPNV